MLEKDIESWAKRKARSTGWYVRKFTSPGNRSVPDDFFAKGGRCFFVEFKATGKLPTELQLEEHKALLRVGMSLYVCDSRAMFEEILGGEEAILAHENSYKSGIDYP